MSTRRELPTLVGNLPHNRILRQVGFQQVAGFFDPVISPALDPLCQHDRVEKSHARPACTKQADWQSAALSKVAHRSDFHAYFLYAGWVGRTPWSARDPLVRLL